MGDESINFKKILAVLMGDHDDVLTNAERLDKVLINLRFEGKASFHKNILEAKKVLNNLSKKIVPHIHIENIYFAFVAKHIPKRQAVSIFLQSEHREILQTLKRLDLLIKELAKSKVSTSQSKLLDKLQEKGTYFTYLLNHHIQIEDDSIFRVVDKELIPKEKLTLVKKIQECSSWNVLVSA